MKMIKSLLLGSAAGIVAMSGAQAADLPLKAKAVEYVRVCSLYGAGFYYIPGTDTCIKLSGYLRVDVRCQHERRRHRQHHRAPAVRRTASPMAIPGVLVKTSTSIRAPRPNTAWSAPSSMRPSAGPLAATRRVYGTTALLADRSPAAPNNLAHGSVAGGTLGVYYAFIQFAGFTMGKAISQFSAPWTALSGQQPIRRSRRWWRHGYGREPVQLHG